MMKPSGSPISRRDRPAKPALTRAGIVAAAVALMRTEGLERVTMRRLADALDTGAASLYVYFHDAADLHAAVLDALLGQVDFAGVSPNATPRDQLLHVLGSYARLLFAHTSVAQSALVTRPSGPHYLALVEALLALLHDEGVPADRAAWGVDLLLLFATATAAEHGTRAQATGTLDDEAALDHALRTASPTTHPHIAALADALVSGSGSDRLAWGFCALINGIASTPRPSPKRPHESDGNDNNQSK